MELKSKKNLHIERKIFHILTGVVAMSLTYLMQWGGKTAGIYAAIIGSFGLLNELIRLRVSSINYIYLRVVKKFARAEEANKFSGLTYYAFGVAITFYFFPWEIANLAIWYLILADPIGAFFGKKYGKRKITENKSWVGCGSFYLTCLVINIIYLNWIDSSLSSNYGFILTAPFVGAISEFIVIKDDNLSIPILSAMGLSFLVMIF